MNATIGLSGYVLSGNQVVYSPNNGYSGTDAFSFKVSDGCADTTPADTTVSISATATNNWRGLSSGMNAPVNVVTQFGSDLVAGGAFTTAGGLSTRYIARWDGTSWHTLGTGTNSTVYATTVYNGLLVAGGNFTDAGGVSANHIASWDGTHWQPLGTGMNSAVWALIVFNNELIAGGSFTTAGGMTAIFVARWDGGRWHPLGSGITGTSIGPFGVSSLTVYDGELIAGGYFPASGGFMFNNIARWDSIDWHPLGSGTDNAVFDLVIYNDELVAGGFFDIVGGATHNIARWDGTDWQTSASGVDTVQALTVYMGGLIAGGGSIAQWDGTNWRQVGMGMDGSVRELATWNGELVAAGDFTMAGDVSANYIAVWGPEP